MNKSIASIHRDGGKDSRSLKTMTLRARWSIIALLALTVFLGLGVLGWFMLRHTPARYTAMLQEQRQTTPEQKTQLASALQNKVLGTLAQTWQKTANAIKTGGAVAPTFETTSGEDSSASSIVNIANTALPTSTAKILDGLVVKNLGQDAQGRWFREVQMGTEQANAWLVGNFENWLTYRDFQMPGQIHRPLVEIHDGRTTLFFTFEDEGVSQVFQADFQIYLDVDGQAHLSLNRLQAGRLPIPVNALGSLAAKLAGHSTAVERASHWMDKIADAQFKPAIKLPDGLKAQVMDYQVNGGQLLLTLRIERYRPSYLHHSVTKLATAEGVKDATLPATDDIGH